MKNRRPSIEQIISSLELRPLDAEGGWFRQTYVSGESLTGAGLPGRFSGERALYTVIFYMVTNRPGEYSALHKLKTDEVWHFYCGDPVRLLVLHPGGSGESVVMGPEILGDHRLQYRVPRETWQGCSLLPGGEYALMGTTMAPGFDPADFTLGRREELVREYPAYRKEIETLSAFGDRRGKPAPPDGTP